MNYKNIIWIFFLTLTVSSCSLSVDTDLAELAVDEIHADYNRGAYGTIYDNASPEFQDFISKDNFSRLLKKLHSGLGQHKKSNRISWSAKTSVQVGTTITLVYQAAYENDDTARESFTFRIKDGLARLYNFNVSSDVLNKKKPPKVTKI
ncbi:hypothetical protein MNBD_ALPHA01-599 [hydrothermal vent metagenome]|uniref:DUF3887 domain-containing protein n=1 Tax=hydrothermal vent metagenome TaxID=652676 RepID=A0A3B0RL27_9ZZZZ